jgi:hypothetical protein
MAPCETSAVFICPLAGCPVCAIDRVNFLLTFSGRSTHVHALEGVIEVAKIHIFVHLSISMLLVEGRAHTASGVPAQS